MCVVFPRVSLIVYLEGAGSSFLGNVITVYQYALRHVADDCLQILFRLLFSCQEKWSECHMRRHYVLLDHVGDGLLRTAISRLDMHNVSNIRPYFRHRLISITKSPARFLSHQDWPQNPTEFNFLSPCNWTYRVLYTWAAVWALLFSLNFCVCSKWSRVEMNALNSFNMFSNPPVSQPPVFFPPSSPEVTWLECLICSAQLQHYGWWCWRLPRDCWAWRHLHPSSISKPSLPKLSSMIIQFNNRRKKVCWTRAKIFIADFFYCW